MPYMVIRHKVQNFESRKVAFDNHAAARSDDLRETMTKAGLAGTPEFSYLEKSESVPV